MLQAMYNEICQGHWMHFDGAICGCGGSGWFLSDLDTFHECSYHHVAGQPHPEDYCCEGYEESNEDQARIKEARTEHLRDAFRTYRQQALDMGLPLADFNGTLPTDAATPAEWVKAARQVVEQAPHLVQMNRDAELDRRQCEVHFAVEIAVERERNLRLTEMGHPSA